MRNCAFSSALSDDVIKIINISFVARRGAGLSDERSEEMTNREGVASGGATPKVFFLHIKKMSAHISHGFKKGNSSAAG